VNKYSVPDDHWEQDVDGDSSATWRDETSAIDIEIEVQLHNEGYQTDKKWTVHCTTTSDDELIAGYAIKHQNKGNYWRYGERWRDAIDFIDLPRPVRDRVAHTLNRGKAEITPTERSIHRADGTGIADNRGDERDV
jgi:hypothetical protein